MWKLKLLLVRVLAAIASLCNRTVALMIVRESEGKPHHAPMRAELLSDIQADRVCARIVPLIQREIALLSPRDYLATLRMLRQGIDHRIERVTAPKVRAA